jgi:hypothetical protein
VRFPVIWGKVRNSIKSGPERSYLWLQIAIGIDGVARETLPSRHAGVPRFCAATARRIPRRHYDHACRGAAEGYLQATSAEERHSKGDWEAWTNDCGVEKPAERCGLATRTACGAGFDRGLAAGGDRRGSIPIQIQTGVRSFRDKLIALSARSGMPRMEMTRLPLRRKSSRDMPGMNKSCWSCTATTPRYAMLSAR